MDYVTLLVQYFLNLDFQDFTSKLVYALQIAEVQAVNFNKDDLKELYWIEENTHKDVKVSYYALDMFVNPTKGIVKPHQPKIELLSSDGKNYVKIPMPSAQKYLCLATRRISELVIKNTQHFNFQFGRNQSNNDDTDIKELFNFKNESTSKPNK
jgi:hypothetical protein